VAEPAAGSPGSQALVLVSKTVYTDAAIDRVGQWIKMHLLFEVTKVVGVSLDFEADRDAVFEINQGGLDQVVLVHEVWQPPIRGVLHYIQQIKAAMPENSRLWILLTQDPGQKNLIVDETDINFDVWKKAVFKLDDPDIKVKRFV